MLLRVHPAIVPTAVTMASRRSSGWMRAASYSRCAPIGQGSARARSCMSLQRPSAPTRSRQSHTTSPGEDRPPRGDERLHAARVRRSGRRHVSGVRAHARGRAPVGAAGGGDWRWRRRRDGRAIPRHGRQSVECHADRTKRRYTTCFFSNLYLAGLRSFDSLTHGYEALTERYGIRIIYDRAAAIEPEAKTVRLNSGTTLPYDRLVVAPGIAFRVGAIDGYDEAATEFMPHAWIAGPQTNLLRANWKRWRMGGCL